MLMMIVMIAHFGSAQTDSIPAEKPKKFNFVPLPVLGYNIDIGFQYGVILNIFNYGDRSRYPDYIYSIYTELSRTTKGSGINQLFFDSKYILPGNIRITADLSYLTELTLNFYGFNGYDAIYNPDFINQQSPDYKSRVFYHHDRRFFRFTTDLQHHTGIPNVNWLAGIGYFSFDIASVNIEKLNKGKNEGDQLPDTELLFDKYRKWGIVSEDEAGGGTIPSLKVGLIYDTRDQEANPMKGIWSEALLFYVPEIAGNHQFTYAKLSVTHRQYFTLVKQRVNLGYRLGYQGTIGGQVPFFMQPYMITSFAKVTTTDGLGGAKSLRGVLRNRVVGDGVAYGNMEVRWKILKTQLFSENLYLAVNSFADAGKVVAKVDLPGDIKQKLDADEIFSDYFDPGSEQIHWTAGAGFQIVYGDNTVINFEYGMALNQRDGDGGIYIGIGYLF
ncbi:MAG: hypothetical protein KQI35_03125 [Bacteroidetes bacterium]|nr:hypothetical protein [Bacteroidota bacterium]